MSMTTIWHTCYSFTFRRGDVWAGTSESRVWEFPRDGESLQECVARWEKDGWHPVDLTRHDHLDNGQIIPTLEPLSVLQEVTA
jgi:hypothetical protein